MIHIVDAAKGQVVGNTNTMLTMSFYSKEVVNLPNYAGELKVTIDIMEKKTIHSTDQ